MFYKEALEFCEYDFSNFDIKIKKHNTFPRFESITNDIQKFWDLKLELLDIFKSTNYNTNHDFLAFVLKHKGTVITTNFDLCIENAVDFEINKVVFDVSDKDPIYNDQFGTLIKVHGCLSLKNNSSLISTIKLLAKTKNGFFNFPKWEKSLLKILQNKTILVLGYSGSDDFDIMPLLKKSTHSRCVWIDYNSNYKKPVSVGKKQSMLAIKIVGINNCELYEGEYIEFLEKFTRCKLRSSNKLNKTTLKNTLEKIFKTEDSKIILANCILFNHQLYEEVILNCNKSKTSLIQIQLQHILSLYKLGNYKGIVKKKSIVDKTDSSEYNLELLHHLSSSYYYLNDYTESKTLNECLLNLSHDSNNKRYLLEGLYLKGSILSNEGKTDEAATIYSEAFPLLQAYDDLEMEAKLNWAFGEIAQKQFEFDKAYLNFKKAKEIYANLNYNNILPILDCNIAGTLADLERVDESVKILESISIENVSVIHFRIYIRFLKVQILYNKGLYNEMHLNYEILLKETEECPGHPYFLQIREAGIKINKMPPINDKLFDKFLY